MHKAQIIDQPRHADAIVLARKRLQLQPQLQLPQLQLPQLQLPQLQLPQLQPPRLQPPQLQYPILMVRRYS